MFVQVLHHKPLKPPRWSKPVCRVQKSKSPGMDGAQPNLCQAHCQTGQQTASKYELPPLPAAAAIGPGFMHAVTEPVFLGTALQTPDLRRATAPAVAIRNCCFRI